MIDRRLVMELMSEAYHGIIFRFVNSFGRGQSSMTLQRAGLGVLARFDFLVVSLLKRFGYRVALLPKRFDPHPVDKVQLPKHPNT
jgi:hypothetical protein